MQANKTLRNTVQIAGDSMPISHELSSEIATALFAAKERSPRELNDLKEIVFEIHSTLERLTDEERMARQPQIESNQAESSNLRSLKAKSAGKDG